MPNRIHLVLGLSLALLAAAASAQAPMPTRDTTRDTHAIKLLSDAERLAKSISSVVGTAISPLVGIGLIGSWGWLYASEAARPELPWYNQPWAWGSVMLLVLLVALKDTLGGLLPLAKKPLDALELIENKLSALVALPIVIHAFMGGMSVQDRASAGKALSSLVPVAHASGGAAAAIDGASIGVIAVLSAIVFVVVWMTGHVVNVLVLLSPFGLLDSLLKLARFAILGAVFATAALHPALGVVTSLAVVIVSLVLFGWSFRFTTLGTLMAVDVLSGRHDDPALERRGLRVFTCAGHPALPVRTMGRIRRDGDVLEFRYRPLLVLPGRVLHLPLPPARYEIGQGLLTPTLVEPRGDGNYALLLRFAPRYRLQVPGLRAKLGAGGVRDLSIHRGLAAMWSFLSGLTRDNANAASA